MQTFKHVLIGIGFFILFSLVGLVSIPATIGYYARNSWDKSIAIGIFVSFIFLVIRLAMM